MPHVAASKPALYGYLAAILCLIAVILLGLLFPSKISANGTIQLAKQEAKIPLNAQLSYLIDETHELRIDTIMTNKAMFFPWKKHGPSTPNFGYIDATIWVKFDVENDSQYSFKRLLEISFPLLDYITIYQTERSHITEEIILGDEQPFHQRPIANRYFVTPLIFDPHSSQTIYVKLKTENAKQLPMTLWIESEFYAKDHRVSHFFGLFYGFMLLMILYNLFIYLSIRDSIYLYYIAYAASMLLLSASMYGVTYEFLWPNQVVWNRYAVPFFVGLSMGLISLFSYKFLKLNSGDLIGRLVLGLSITSFGFAGTSFFLPTLYSYQLAAYNVVLVCPVSFIIALYIASKGSREALFFALSWASLLAGASLMAMNKAGIVPHNLFTEYGLQIGSAAEIVLLSFALATSISNLKEDQLRAKKAEIEAMEESQSKSTFLAKMSHEIRTPMNGVLGMAQLLQDTELSEEQKHYSNVILSSTETLLNIINDILDYSKIEAQQITLEAQAFDLKKLITDILGLFSVNLRATDVELIASIQPGIHTKLIGDPTRIRQIIINLLSNAIKFTNHGFIIIEITQANPESNTLKFSVRDSGMGIPEKQQPLLFKVFSQLHNPDTPQIEGTGLGLAITKQLAEIMGGEVGVISSEGKGANFWVTLALEPDKQALNGQQDVNKNLAANRLLLGCHEPACAEVIKKYLVNNHYHVSTATDLKTFADTLLAHNKAFDYLYLDASLGLADPENEVYLKEIYHSNIPVILITPTDFIVNNKIKRLAIKHIIYKPIFTEQLLPSYFTQHSNHLLEGQHGNPFFAKMPNISLNILVAEDNEVNQLVIKAILSHLGHQSTIVSNGMLAITTLHGDKQFDLLLVDCEMPVLDGFETTKEIRRQQALNKLPALKIIALSAHAMEENKQQCLDVGMDDYLSKPIKQKELEALINQLTSPSITNFSTKR